MAAAAKRGLRLFMYGALWASEALVSVEDGPRPRSAQATHKRACVWDVNYVTEAGSRDAKAHGTPAVPEARITRMSEERNKWQEVISLFRAL